MNIPLLQTAVTEIKDTIENSIRTRTFDGNTYPNGQKAKEALIRSSKLILRIHEVVKQSLVTELNRVRRNHRIYPPLNQSVPELSISGFIKAKNQDVVVLFDGDRPTSERIQEGPLAETSDEVGKDISERSIVIGVRSQLSSIAKNFDTLMERAFAETLNLRLRLPELVMGEAYLLPIYEYDDRAMEQNTVRWKPAPVPVEKFIRTFLGISGRTSGDTDIYKYERSALILFDTRVSPPKLFLTLDELKQAGVVSNDFNGNFNLLSPQNFAEQIISAHQRRHPPRP